MTGHIALFVAAFVAATMLPAQSEAVLAGIMKEPFQVFVLLVGLAKTARGAILAATTTGIV